jgi:hypothetical protein
MQGSKKIVIISIISILLISIVVSVIGWNFRTYDSNFSDQKCKRNGEYCIYNKIPEGMMFTKPSQSMDGVHKFTGDPSEYLVFIYDSPKNPDMLVRREEFSPWGIQDYKCKSTDEEPEVIDYFSEFCSSNIRYGCGNGRRAIVCGDGYLIQDTTDYESQLYGPYNMP